MHKLQNVITEIAKLNYAEIEYTLKLQKFRNDTEEILDLNYRNF